MVNERRDCENEIIKFNASLFQKRCLEKIPQSSLDPTSRHVYRVLVSQALIQSTVCPSISGIMLETGYSKPTIYSCIEILQKNRFIQKIKIPKRHGLGNCYELDQDLFLSDDALQALLERYSTVQRFE